MAGTATDARKTSVTARHAARAPELATGAATDTRDTALPARTPAGTAVLAAGAAGTVGVAATPAWVLLEHDVGGRRTSHRWAGRESFSCCHRRHSNRRSNSSTNYQRFHQVEFRYHARPIPTSTHVQNIFAVVR